MLNESAANGLLQILGFPINAGGPAVLADPQAPRGEDPAGFLALLGTIGDAVSPSAVAGNPLPATGDALPVVPPILPTHAIGGVADPQAVQMQAVDPEHGIDTHAGATRTTDTIGRWLSSAGPAPGLSMVPGSASGQSALRPPTPGRPEVSAAPVVTARDAIVTGDQSAAGQVTTETGRQAAALTLARQPPPPETGQIGLPSAVARHLVQQAVGRDPNPRRDMNGALHGDKVLNRATAGLTPVNVATAGAERVALQAPEQLAQLAVSGTAEKTELPDLQFESLRIAVREPTGERPAAGRSTPLELPAPRHPVGHPEWARSLGERLVVMARGEHQVARLSLNPEHLGPVDIKLHINEDQARLWFTAQHPQAREALEAAVPRLREMFAQQGLDLSQHMGRDDGPRHDRDDGRGYDGVGAYPTYDDEGGATPEAHLVEPAHGRRGLVDHFA